MLACAVQAAVWLRFSILQPLLPIVYNDATLRAQLAAALVQLAASPALLPSSSILEGGQQVASPALLPYAAAPEGGQLASGHPLVGLMGLVGEARVRGYRHREVSQREG